mmetsp:Transcript_8450/g.12239  ORF Transcript_8450/g.12239 Transcript_8450/m.12239 type:complete len:136 (-) Transcript_8450:462-869(-)
MSGSGDPVAGMRVAAGLFVGKLAIGLASGRGVGFTTVVGTLVGVGGDFGIDMGSTVGTATGPDSGRFVDVAIVGSLDVLPGGVIGIAGELSSSSSPSIIGNVDGANTGGVGKFEKIGETTGEIAVGSGVDTGNTM